jgi:hypothetical protein
MGSRSILAMVAAFLSAPMVTLSASRVEHRGNIGSPVCGRVQVIDEIALDYA